MTTQLATGGEDTGLLLKEALAGRPGGSLTQPWTHWPHPRPEPVWYSPSIPGLGYLPGFLVTRQIRSHIGLSASAP